MKGSIMVWDLPRREVPLEWMETRDWTGDTTFYAAARQGGAEGLVARAVSGIELCGSPSITSLLWPILNDLADAAVRAWRYDLWRGWGDALLAGDV